METVSNARTNPANGLLEVSLVGMIGWHNVSPKSLNVPDSFILDRANNPSKHAQWMGYDMKRKTLHLITDL